MNTDIYKKMLEEEKITLEKELQENGGILDEATGNWDAVPPELDNQEVSDDNDTADRAEEYEERTSIVKTLSSRLRDVTDALGKIDTGTYGMCEISKTPIEEDRLMANPAARTCKAHME